MTIVGKILVFINLLFSLFVGWLAVMSYTARTHWVEGFNNLQKSYQVAQANAQQYYKEKLEAEARAGEQVGKLNDQLTARLTEIEGYKTSVVTARNELEKQKALSAQAEAAAKQAQADAGRRQLEVGALQKTLNDEIGRNNELTKKTNEAREKQVASDIRADRTQARAEQLEAQLREAEKQLADVRNAGGGTGPRTPSGVNPPRESVEGVVKQADSSGLLRLSIGSDAGLAKGHTLELFRIASVASQSKYLGRVRVLDVTAHEAVAQPVGRLSDRPQVGDRVASRL